MGRGCEPHAVSLPRAPRHASPLPYNIEAPALRATQDGQPQLRLPSRQHIHTHARCPRLVLYHAIPVQSWRFSDSVEYDTLAARSLPDSHACLSGRSAEPATWRGCLSMALLDPSMVGHETRPETVRITSEDIRAFAAAIGDTNPIFF